MNFLKKVFMKVFMFIVTLAAIITQHFGDFAF